MITASKNISVRTKVNKFYDAITVKLESIEDNFLHDANLADESTDAHYDVFCIARIKRITKFYDQTISLIRVIHSTF